MEKILIRIMVLAGLPTATYFGMVEGIEGALNLVKFFVWIICFPLVVFSLFELDGEKLEKSPKSQSSKFTNFITGLVSLGCLFTMVWTGHLATATAWGFFLAAVATASKNSKKRQAEDSGVSDK